jgi:hypothetical protein
MRMLKVWTADACPSAMVALSPSFHSDVSSLISLIRARHVTIRAATLTQWQ